MQEPQRSVADRLLNVILSVVTLPLLLGGLVAAGETSDPTVLLYGALSLLVLGSVNLGRHLQG